MRLIMIIIILGVCSCSTIFKPVDEQTKIKYERAWVELYGDTF